MAQYDQNDWASRLIGALPNSWFSSTAITGGGVLYTVALAIVANFPFHTTQVNYQALQTRLITATDVNLDQISTDFFGTALPRVPGESDNSYRARIEAALIAPKSTIAAIQNAVNFYLDNFYVPPFPGSFLGMDTVGGVDTIGGMDGSPTVQPLPVALVFDLMTNAELSAIVGNHEPQFVVLLQFTIPVGTGWFLNRDPNGYLGRSTFLENTGSIIIFPAAPDAGLANVVNETKAEGTIPIYASQRIVTSSGG